MRLNGENYLQFLQEELPELLEDVPLDVRRRMWFQHDGAPAHSTRIVRDWLDQRFPGRWIGRGGPVSWPLRSPDLNPLDFFLWGHVEGEVVYGRTRVSERVSPGVMHIIRSETLAESLGKTLSKTLGKTLGQTVGNTFSDKKSRHESRRESRIGLYAWLPARLSPRVVFLRG